jgi:hypothetical protein
MHGKRAREQAHAHTEGEKESKNEGEAPGARTHTRIDARTLYGLADDSMRGNNKETLGAAAQRNGQEGDAETPVWFTIWSVKTGFSFSAGANAASAISWKGKLNVATAARYSRNSSATLSRCQFGMSLEFCIPNNQPDAISAALQHACVSTAAEVGHTSSTSPIRFASSSLNSRHVHANSRVRPSLMMEGRR